MHILPGIDDGSRTLDDAVGMAAEAKREGTRIVVATPHVSTRYDNDSCTVATLVDRLNARLDDERVEVQILAGAEIALTRVSQLADEELSRLTLGGGDWLLIEPPFTPVAPHLGAMIMAVMERGHHVVIAHPERCPAMHREPKMIADLVRAGALTSVTSGALAGRFGQRVRNFALRLLEESLVHNLASDAHDLLHRPPSLRSDAQRAHLDGLLDWLTLEVPMAILRGGSVPKAPATPPSGSQIAGGLLARLRRH